MARMATRVEELDSEMKKLKLSEVDSAISIKKKRR
jgi:hypothetical protein